jgi:signal peptidase II
VPRGRREEEQKGKKMSSGPTKKGLGFFLVLILILFDRAIKSILIKFPPEATLFVLVPNFLEIKTLINTGIAFGLFKEFSYFFFWLNLLVIIYLFYLFCFEKKGIYFFPLALILSGAISNLIDRMLYGGVLDYIDFKFWPVFNLADAFISIGIALIVKDAIFRRRKGIQV